MGNGNRTKVVGAIINKINDIVYEHYHCRGDLQDVFHGSAQTQFKFTDRVTPLVFCNTCLFMSPTL